jgi:hypothetical protein
MEEAEQPPKDEQEEEEPRYEDACPDCGMDCIPLDLAIALEAPCAPKPAMHGCGAVTVDPE